MGSKNGEHTLNPGFKVGSSMKWVQHAGSIIVTSLIQKVMVNDAKKAHKIRASEVIYDFGSPCFNGSGSVVIGVVHIECIRQYR